MTTEQALALKPGEQLNHSWLGPVSVVTVMVSFGSLFGVQVRAESDAGRQRLERASRMPGDTPFLEDLPRRLSFAAADAGRP